MINIKNLRIEDEDRWSKLTVDIESDFSRSDKESTVWIAVEKKYKSMLNDLTYNAFCFLPLFMGMYYKSDVHIHGKVSKLLFHNIHHYIEDIIKYFKDNVKKVNFQVDGFEEIPKTGTLIGTGFSCGIDNLCTVYDNYVLENDTDFRINCLFMLNCGWHGNYYNPNTYDLFLKRASRNKKASDEMGLPLYLVNSNLHAFLPQLDDQASYFCLYSCAFALEKALKIYYISSSYSYYDVLRIGFSSRNRDFSEFADPIAIPLMYSKHLRLVSDGCQYERTEKTKRIVDWDIAHNYLNVCCKNDNEQNCSICNKCVRTLLALDALGKLDEYDNVFDIEAYRKISFNKKCHIRLNGMDSNDGFSSELYRFYQLENKYLPNWMIARITTLPETLAWYTKRVLGKRKK